MGHPEGVGQGDDIVSPINGTNLIPGIIKCNENGVKEINLGPGVDEAALEEAGGYLDAKITVDFKTVANHIIARLPEGGQVAILAGLAGAGQSEGRTAGAKEILEAAEGIELMAIQNCDCNASLAYDATKALITEYPDLKAIFCCNIPNGFGAAPRQHTIENPAYDSRLVFHDLRLSIRSSLVAVQLFVLEDRFSGFHGHSMTHSDIVADGLTLRLSKTAVKCKHQFTGQFLCVDVFLFKQDTHTLLFE